MGLVRSSFTARDSDTAVTRFSGKSSTVVHDADDGRRAFVSNFYAANPSPPYERLDSLYRSSRITIQTDGSGVQDLKLELRGKCSYTGNIGSSTSENEHTCTGPIYWAVSTSSSSRPSSGNRINISTSWDGSKWVAAANLSSTQSGIKLVPNTTYYLWIWYDGTCVGYGANGLTLTASGVYGVPGAITAANTTFDSATTISYAANPTTGASYTVSVSIEGLTAETLQTKGGASSISWTPDFETYRSQITNKKDATATITVSTYYGTQLSGTKTKTITVSFTEAQAAPSLAAGAFGIAAKNTGAISGMSGYIQNYSEIEASFDSSKATLLYGASVAKWSVKVGSLAAEDVAAETATYDSGVITSSGAVEVVCTMTDSRGFTASQSFTATFIPYEMPSLVATITRADGSSNVSISFSGTYASISDQNTLTVQYYYKKADEQNYGSPATITGATVTTSGTNKVAAKTETVTVSTPNYSYDFKLVITDTVGNTAEYTARLASDRWALHIRNGGVGAAFGKSAERNNELDIGSWKLTAGEISCTAISSGIFLIEPVTMFNSESIAADTATSGVSVTVSKPGYYPLGVVGWTSGGTGNTNVFVVTIHLSAQSSGSATVYMRVRNTSSSSVTFSSSAKVLWVKETS